ncbi:sulfite exporter TauE/SafE family protein [Homoserinimonas sp. OAct 916]|uniref:sulfite exporter TauE/SafE family protein n=1 Tax=Homoserinimonas sp. OAct 916 TaxID=2211450 RepID=UPI001E3FC2D0|nr:sulfite exporter TauE/SafE family protein [Homoserinimonas sp. OAct 916]
MTNHWGRVVSLAVIGVLVGFFSGLFGVGGGIILVPMLVGWLGFDQRRASGTSLAAILPTAVSGMITYAMQGSVDWIAGACLAIGAIGGSLLGTWLLSRIRQDILRWIFIAFIVLVAVRMFFLVPNRAVELQFDLGEVVALLAVGFVTGTLSGLLGIGGGVVVVPSLMLLFGVGDVVAKGTSLLMMIPTSLTGTIANVRRGNSDLRAALVIGCLSVPASIGGATLAGVLPPLLSSVLFGLLLLYSAAQLGRQALRARQVRRPVPAP